MRPLKFCLGIEFTQDEYGIKMSQKDYIRDVLNRFGMSDCKAVSTPIESKTKLTKNTRSDMENGCKYPYRELVGALMYLSVATRPDIAHVASMLGQFSSCAGDTH